MEQHRHRHGGHHRHSRKRRFFRWVRHNKNIIIFTGVLALAAAAGTGIWISHTLQAQQARHVTAGNSVNMGSGYRHITYNGKNYQYNTLITTVLYAGIDSEGVIEPGQSYTGAPRADSINLVILDEKDKTMTIMALNRDTMTDIRRYTVSGRDRGTYVSHLGLAYTYGDGGEASCENLREAVSELLYGIPINEYVVTNRSSLPYLNDLVGGVTVTVPNSDLEADYPEFQEGAAVTLTNENIETFLRSRDTGEDFSNEGRMERQRAFMTAYTEQFKDLAMEDPNGLWNQMEEMEDYVQTSITKNKYLDLAGTLEQVSFTPDNYYTPAGEDQLGELHDEFHVDEDALLEQVISLFYEEI